MHLKFWCSQGLAAHPAPAEIWLFSPKSTEIRLWADFSKTFIRRYAIHKQDSDTRVCSCDPDLDI